MGLKSWIVTQILTGKLPLWMYRFLGKEIQKKLNWEDNMADPTVPDTRPWYKKKTIWAAIVTGLVGLIQPISASFGHPIAVPLWIIEFLSGVGLYSLQDRINTLLNK